MKVRISSINQLKWWRCRHYFLNCLFVTFCTNNWNYYFYYQSFYQRPFSEVKEEKKEEKNDKRNTENINNLFCFERICIFMAFSIPNRIRLKWKWTRTKEKNEKEIDSTNSNDGPNQSALINIFTDFVSHNNKSIDRIDICVFVREKKKRKLERNFNK